MAVGKVVFSLVSLILVVGVVIGAVVMVRDGDSKDENTTASMKAVAAVCAPVPYKEACAKSVEPAAKNPNSDTKDFVMAAINATIDEVIKAYDVTKSTNVDKEKDPYNHMAVEDCKDLLQSAIADLQASFSAVGDSELHTLRDRENELLNWLSAVHTYQSDCLDQIENPGYKSAIENGMINATQLTHNAINMVAELSVLLETINKVANLQPKSRRLLEVAEMGKDNYPTWFSAADRKLLAKHAHGRIVPHAVVAKDGSGKFKTITDAINSYPKNHKGRYNIYVKAGVYTEYVTIDKKKPNIFLYGDGAGKTIITGQKNFAKMKITTQNTATFSNLAPGFIARGVTFRNTAGAEGHQAVALRIQGDMSAVFDCSIEGYQDTLYYQTYRQFYRNCVISGTIDFIFGKGLAVIQNSLIIVRKPLDNQINTVTADGKEWQHERKGLVLQNCRIVPEKQLYPMRFKIATYLGRPWKAYALTVTMQSELGDLIRPEGYLEWQGEKNHETCEMYEYGNRGPGARTNMRNKLFKKFKVLGSKEAAKYTAGSFLDGQYWLKNTGAPFQLGL